MNNSKKYKSQLMLLRNKTEYIQVNVSTDSLDNNRVIIFLAKSKDNIDFTTYLDENLSNLELNFEDTIDYLITYFENKGYHIIL